MPVRAAFRLKQRPAGMLTVVDANVQLFSPVEIVQPVVVADVPMISEQSWLLESAAVDTLMTKGNVCAAASCVSTTTKPEHELIARGAIHEEAFPAEAVAVVGPRKMLALLRFVFVADVKFMRPSPPASVHVIDHWAFPQPAGPPVAVARSWKHVRAAMLAVTGF